MMTDSKRVLIIDDDKAIRETYRDVLSVGTQPDMPDKGHALFDTDSGQADSASPAPESYDVTLACSGSQGIEEVQQALSQEKPFSVAFIDMTMPGLDGARTARNIWGMDPAIKIVIVTAYSENSPDEITRLVGRNDIFFLLKPFKPGGDPPVCQGPDQ